MSKMPDVSLLKRVGEVEGDDPDDTVLLGNLWTEAHRYIASFRWCPKILDAYLAFGVGGVIGVFLVRFAEKIGETDDWLWVVSGDLPSAYLVVGNASTPELAMLGYCELMEDWADAFAAGRSLEGVFSVDAQPTKENARMLRSRTDFIRHTLIPECRERTRRSIESAENGKSGSVDAK